jgi:hypothetical protein
MFRRCWLVPSGAQAVSAEGHGVFKGIANVSIAAGARAVSTPWRTVRGPDARVAWQATGGRGTRAVSVSIWAVGVEGEVSTQWRTGREGVGAAMPA